MHCKCVYFLSVMYLAISVQLLNIKLHHCEIAPVESNIEHNISFNGLITQILQFVAQIVIPPKSATLVCLM